MRWIYISPHLDDAVLSAGGLIYEQTRAGDQVEIWTLLCGSPTDQELSSFAQVLHYSWGISDTAELIRARRAEDSQACKLVGATPVHFDFLDCIYRRGKNGEWLYGDIYAAVHEDEADFPARIAEAVSTRLQPTDQLACQLGLGSHVDHVLVRRAVDLLQRPTLYYADIPYFFKSPETLGLHTAGMKENAYAVGEAGLWSWQEAVAAYTSQIESLFDSPEAMRGQIQQYCSENGGIRLWSSD
ncbi:MAG: PIG-L family deacetylase [Anaerolineales bacterium]|nr:MAG: PIG-L family deacetylase [Anaerolineales bacterium]